MQMVLLDVEKKNLSVVDPESYEERCLLLGAENTETFHVHIRGVGFHLITDDEACLVQNPKVSAITSDGEFLFYGNLLIAGEDDEEGEYTAVSDEAVEVLRNCCKVLPTILNPEGCCMLTNVELDY